MRTLAALTTLALLTAPAFAAPPDYLDDRSTPEAVVSSYYNAINRQEYTRAWSYYRDGQGVAPFADFVEGYADTARVRVAFGNVTSEGAAGSTYYQVPVSLDARSAGGAHSYFAGCYTLRLADPAIQAAPPFTPMHIVEGHLRTVGGFGVAFAPANCD